ncbi:hypothetical protein D3C71_1910560 [compost metagenome]
MPDCLKPPNGMLMSPPSKQLTHTLPARRPRAIWWARERSRVHRLAARPYGVSLAMRRASRWSRAVMTESTGPKISSRAMVMSLLTLSKMVGGM